MTRFLNRVRLNEPTTLVIILEIRTNRYQHLLLHIELLTPILWMWLQSPIWILAVEMVNRTKGIFQYLNLPYHIRTNHPVTWNPQFGVIAFQRDLSKSVNQSSSGDDRFSNRPEFSSW